MCKFLNKKKTPAVFLLCLLVLLMQGSSTVLAVDPVHHWTLDEDTAAGATTVADSAGSNPGTITNAVTVPGVIGNALYFDGTGDWVDIDNFSTAELGAMTITFWMNPESLPGSFIRVISAVDDWEVILNGDDGTVGNNLYRGTGTYPESTPLPLGEWTFVAMTVAAPMNGAMEVYTNGVYDTPVNATTLSDGDVSVSSFNFGSRQNTGNPTHYQGMLDDIRIYNQVLSAEDIKAIYDSAFPGPEAEYPADGAKGVPQVLTGDYAFQWTYTEDADVAIDSYTIFMDTDAGLVAEPNLPDQPMLIDGTGDATGILPAGESDPSASYSDAQLTLEMGTTYYWRVVANIREPNAVDPGVYDKPAIVSSPVWSFETLTPAPVVEAGEKVITWLQGGKAVIPPDGRGAGVTDDDLRDILWSVEEPQGSTAVQFDPDNAADTTITIDAAGIYTLKLWADDDKDNEGEDLVQISVYADSCQAAKNNPAGYTAPQYDFNDDCKQDLVDFAMFAQFWLQDNGLEEYLPYDIAGIPSVPVVYITWPTDGETISGAAGEVRNPADGGMINAIAYNVFDETMTDGSGIAGSGGGVLFQLLDSESNVVASHGENVASYDWANLDTTVLADGTYTLRVTARGNTQPTYRDRDEITVIIDNTP